MSKKEAFLGKDAFVWFDGWNIWISSSSSSFYSVKLDPEAVHKLKEFLEHTTPSQGEANDEN